MSILVFLLVGLCEVTCARRVDTRTAAKYNKATNIKNAHLSSLNTVANATTTAFCDCTFQEKKIAHVYKSLQGWGNRPGVYQNPDKGSSVLGRIPYGDTFWDLSDTEEGDSVERPELGWFKVAVQKGKSFGYGWVSKLSTSEADDRFEEVPQTVFPVKSVCSSSATLKRSDAASMSIEVPSDPDCSGLSGMMVLRETSKEQRKSQLMSKADLLKEAHESSPTSGDVYAKAKANIDYLIEKGEYIDKYTCYLTCPITHTQILIYFGKLKDQVKYLATEAGGRGIDYVDAFGQLRDLGNQPGKEKYLNLYKDLENMNNVLGMTFARLIDDSRAVRNLMLHFAPQNQWCAYKALVTKAENAKDWHPKSASFWDERFAPCDEPANVVPSSTADQQAEEAEIDASIKKVLSPSEVSDGGQTLLAGVVRMKRGFSFMQDQEAGHDASAIQSREEALKESARQATNVVSTRSEGDPGADLFCGIIVFFVALACGCTVGEAALLGAIAAM